MASTNINVKYDPGSRVVPFYSYKNITTQTTTLVKSGGGFLHSITFNHPVTNGVVEIDDAVTNTTPIIATVTTNTNPAPFTVIYDVEFTTGLSITTSVANQDITVSYL